MNVLKLPIRWKIIFLSFGIVLFSLLIGGIIITGKIVDMREEELGKRGMITARTVAQLPEVQKQIQKKNGAAVINPIVENIRVINNTDYIVVLNMEGIRYSHPVQSLIGTSSTGKDEGPAFADHTYLSKAKGDLGIAVRAFMPIKNNKLEQVGVVIVGNILPGYLEILQGLKAQIALIMFLTLLFGLLGSWMLARHIKQQMFELEPHQIVRMYEESTAAFHAMHEGVIAIDMNEKITIFNERAKDIFDVTGHPLGKPIRSVIPDTRLPEIIEYGKAVFNQEINVSGNIIISNRIPIKVDKSVIGAVAIFQDRTEVAKMAEELTGVKAFVEALRIQNHEHLNKLHTIAGLIQLDKKKQALQYVFDITKQQESLTRLITKNIRNDSIAGLLLSKVSRGKELKIEVIIDSQSHLQHLPPHLNEHDFVIILGNLIENSFYALNESDTSLKKIDVSIEQDHEVCALLVEDNGPGIPEELLPDIFVKGVTTKGEEGLGIGLYLVKDIVNKGKGEISLSTFPGGGTSFYITFPMK
ncbi:two-component system, CitB family, sensor histidine kinase DctS [Fictibacillus enclensis]|uniref:histidine kinase n=1 Tax=Fictibacillus enclensis TaxID=1017270 RepID=A0A0V8JDU9_9BACL|nr:sensor histidine kinase [Fictibacillus enclensis]KSU85319.1 histidine kinase [Fictibacillus enclensis]SCB94881.1 two-component system, CitB family, sensor histidine kinase DctS [Fictibacillus enclensis]